MPRLRVLAACAAMLLGACAPRDEPPGVRVLNSSGDELFVAQAGGEASIPAGGSLALDCSARPCASLTLRSPICAYGYDLAPLYAQNPDLSVALVPVQIEMDFTLYMLPRGARRPARTPPSDPEARMRPDSVDC